MPEAGLKRRRRGGEILGAWPIHASRCADFVTASRAASTSSEARAFLRWLIAVGEVLEVVIRDRDDAVIDPADELRRL